MFSQCSAKRRASDKDLPVKLMDLKKIGDFSSLKICEITEISVVINHQKKVKMKILSYTRDKNHGSKENW
jgi:hypothetical protein